MEETVSPDAVVDRHADDAVAREAAAVIPGGRGRSVLKHTAGNPEHHRLAGRPEIARPDVERQAIFASDCHLGEESRDVWRDRRLWRSRAKGDRITHSAPGRGRLWRSKPMSAKWWRRVRDALERLDVIDDAATDQAIPSLDNDIRTHGLRLSSTFRFGINLCKPTATGRGRLSRGASGVATRIRRGDRNPAGVLMETSPVGVPAAGVSSFSSRFRYLKWG